MADNTIHTPVLLERSIELLAPALNAPGAVLVDGTLGMAGHAEAFLQRFPDLTLVGIDRDEDALAIARRRLEPFASRTHFVHAVYDEIPQALDSLGITSVEGIFFDLGVSSLQLDRVERGFSYSQDAPLDMRMDASTPVTAEHILATYSELELRRIFYAYGDEKLAPRFASRIVQFREQQPLTTSAQLVELVIAATPAAAQRAGHPAKRVFQALRIEVNQELSVLERAIPAAVDSLTLGGRMVVLAYQSLEDRIVKRELQRRAKSTAPAGLPVELPEHKPELKLLVRGSEQASEAEQALNPRAKPVRLRAIERMRVIS
ncbi:16S rRNA (cytosine(1402)-N(4))-methyltransferase RsmH [Salinibacterium sp. SWN167]|uniref:16S rRNA (cytosine(1402)-N(4))-methyltransferase RsmH n=1 Tax=Salinibacterium sp. SWN167 TaxID=2792054 RepID=UPI0018CDB762|nr:16S rRNA (cytosine(1402)-N(4))-methyltransferase RsmH [Salinibacterium sp. SWN167]MBH0083616.1 16S rRNA (cytosine(1402)-N(4))-methyltransferase RsmH [Salinibacterium sp. SWN167]